MTQTLARVSFGMSQPQESNEFVAIEADLERVLARVRSMRRGLCEHEGAGRMRVGEAVLHFFREHPGRSGTDAVHALRDRIDTRATDVPRLIFTTVGSLRRQRVLEKRGRGYFLREERGGMD